MQKNLGKVDEDYEAHEGHESHESHETDEGLVLEAQIRALPQQQWQLVSFSL